MTVKELKTLLEACNDDAVVFIEDSFTGVHILRDEYVYQNPVEDGKTEVIIDITRDIKWESQ